MPDRTSGSATVTVMATPGIFARIGRACARNRWWVVGAWAVLALLALPLAVRAPGALRAGGFSSPELEASRARALLEDRLDLPSSALVVLVQSRTDRGAGDPAFESAVLRALARLPEAEHVVEVLPHTLAPTQVSTDGRTVYEIVGLDLEPDSSPQAIDAIREAILPQPGIDISLAGGPASYGDIQAVSEEDLRRSELISLPLAALALLVVFGSVVAAGVPIVVGGLAVVVALAIIFVVASLTPMSIFVLNLATLLGIGLGVDYALLMTSRFREELRARRGATGARGAAFSRAAVEEVVAITLATAGRAVFFSGVTVLLGLLAMLLFEFMVLRSVGVAGAIVVALAVTASLTLLPAGLAILGERIEALPVSRRVTGRREGGAKVEGSRGAWWRLADRVMDHPLAVFAPTLLFLLVLGAPFLSVRLNAPDATILPTDVPSRRAFDALTREFQAGEFGPLLLAVRTQGPVTDPANIERLHRYSRVLAADPRVARVTSLVDVDPRLTLEQYQLMYASPSGPADRYVAEGLVSSTDGDLTAVTLVTWHSPNDEEARALVADLRAADGALAPPDGLEVLVAGGAAEVVDVVDRIASDFPRAALFIMVTTYLVLLILLRSVVLPAKALVMNSLSILASFGALVWIFQEGNLSAPLGFTPLGFVETTLPVILFCVLFGLSMDYEVFLLTRMKEVWDGTGDNRTAVASGLERSGRIVTSAALIVVVVAGSFALAEIVLIKAVGLGVAIAVALDATVVRALLVPSAMRLLGDRNWWLPVRLQRWLGTRLPAGAALAATLPVGLALLIGLAVAGCGGPILANPVPSDPPRRPIAEPSPTEPAGPSRIELPRDDAPHRRLTEWWYHTGHLEAAEGRTFGFELVVFRAERGLFPVAWASHAAVTDESGRRFLFDQRSEVGPQVDRSSAGRGFDLVVSGEAAPGVRRTADGWRMSGAMGRHRLLVPAARAEDGTSFGLQLQLDDEEREPMLHDRDGYVDFGPAGGSWYMSRPRMAASGTLTLGDERITVSGTAWFDHQWGDFISVGGGGWDWFAVNLDDGTDLTLSLVRDAQGGYPLVYGTIRHPSGEVRHLDRAAFEVEALGSWTSARTGIRWPAGWTIRLPGEKLALALRPSLAVQELDTRSTSGVVYWEGSQEVVGSRDGSPLDGQAYVELTGYGPGLSGSDG